VSSSSAASVRDFRSALQTADLSSIPVRCTLALFINPY